MSNEDDSVEEDDGAPVTELHGLSISVDEGFGDQVRGRIERRLLTGDLLELAWTAPFIVLVEWLTMPFRMLHDRQNR